MKKLIVLNLLIILLMLPLISEESRNLPENSTELQTDLQKTYSADDVRFLVEQIKQAGDEQIEKAYDEGYKAGILEYEPKLEGFKLQYDILEKENKKLKSNQWQKPVYIALGIAGGFFFGYMVKAVS